MVDEYKTGKVFAMYSDGHAIKVGETTDNAKWFDVAEDIQKYIDKDYKNADIRYKERQKGKRREIFVLFKQEKDSKGKPAEEKPEVKNTKEENKPDQAYWAAKDETLSRQGAIRTAAIAIQKLEGGVSDLETLEQQVIMLAEKFSNWIKGII